MYRTVALSSEHYASKWPTPSEETALNSREDVNALGIAYALASDPEEKQAKLFQIVEAFHGYLMKYMVMIIRGHLPSLKTSAGRDAKAFLRLLLPLDSKTGKQVPPSRKNLMGACRSLHLAFKQAESNDIYDTLVMCLISAAAKYDPQYTDKVRRVCEALDGEFKEEPTVSIAQLSSLLGFDCTGHVRVLVKHGFLASVREGKKRVLGYQRTEKWPAPSKFFNMGPIYFTYFLQQQFRLYLHAFICTQMQQIETDEGMLQLDHRNGAGRQSGKGVQGIGDEKRVPSIDGAFTDAHGDSWLADVTLMSRPLDVSTMDLDWVEHTEDRLFRTMTRHERYLLYLVFVEECNWKEAAAKLGQSVNLTKKHFNEIMLYLQSRATPKAKL